MATSEAAKFLSTELEEEVTEKDVENLLLEGHMTGSISADDWICYPTDKRNGPEKINENSHKDMNAEGYNTPQMPEIISGIYPISASDLNSDRNHIYIELSEKKATACYAIDQPDDERIRIYANLPSTRGIYKNVFLLKKKELESMTLQEKIQSALYPLKKPSICVSEMLISTQEILKFIDIAKDVKPEKPLDNRERASLEKIILVLAKQANYKLITPYSDAEALSAAAAKHGVALPTVSTIVKFLNAAASHDNSKKS